MIPSGSLLLDQQMTYPRPMKRIAMTPIATPQVLLDYLNLQAFDLLFSITQCSKKST